MHKQALLLVLINWPTLNWQVCLELRELFNGQVVSDSVDINRAIAARQ